MKIPFFLSILLLSVFSVSFVLAQDEDEGFSNFNQIDLNEVQRVVVFGDSTVDIGNTFELTGGAFPVAATFDGVEGRYSNGPLWWEQLQDNWFGSGVDFTCYGYGGAGVNSETNPESSFEGFPGTENFWVVPGLIQQVQEYLEDVEGVIPPGTMFLFSVGSNDLVKRQPPPTNELEIGALTDSVTEEMFNAAQTLLGVAGPRSWVVVTGFLPLGQTPAFNGQPAVVQDLYDTIAFVSNGLLQLKIGGLDAGIRAVACDPDSGDCSRAIFLDPTADWGLLRFNPGYQEFDDITNQCYNPLDDSTCSRPSNYFFWDHLHPTSGGGHRWVRDVTYKNLFEQGEGYGSSASSIQISIVLFIVSIIFFNLFI